MLNVLTCPTAVVFALTGVSYAGSLIWQPQITRYDHLELEHDHEALHRRIIRDLSDPPSVEASSVHKRALLRSYIGQQRWPNNEIKYCYATRHDKDMLDDYVIAAVALWDISGLSSENYKVTRISPLECQRQRSTVLEIRLDEGHGFSTTVGYTPADLSIAYFGPTLNFDDSISGRLLEKSAKMAHHLGHVWGLHHEHQNPALWKEEHDYTDAVMGKVFGDDTFHCENIVGYSELADHANEEFPDGAEFMCHDMNMARGMGFRGVEFLPLEADGVMPINERTGHTAEAVDWESIMIFDSFAASSNRRPVLMKPGGALIEFNLNPSNTDIAAIDKMYTIYPRLHQELQLLNQESSQYYDLFKRLYRSSRGDPPAVECMPGGGGTGPRRQPLLARDDK